MASGAGLNCVGNNGGVILLTVVPTSTVVAAPTVAYGSNSGSPSRAGNDSGGTMFEGKGFTKWTFQLVGGGTGYGITIYGTIDPAAYLAYTQAFQTLTGPQSVFTGIPASSWVPLPGPSEQTGTGGISNPLTTSSPLLISSGAWVGVRAVLTSMGGSPTGIVSVIGFAVP